MSMGNNIIATVPGKVMLIGEHSVVYGGACISSTVDKCMTVITSEHLTDTDEIIIPKDAGNQFIISALNCLRTTYKIPSLTISTSSEITGFGLGSSAAVVVGVVAGVSSLFALGLSKKEIFDISLSAVLSVQKIASGFDIATSLYGGTILFNGKTKETTQLVQKNLPLLVFFSRKKVSTVRMIEKVKENYHRNLSRLTEYFSQIDTCVEIGKKALLNKDWEKLGNAMTKNHSILKYMEVSTPYLDKMVEISLQNGAYGAKLSGAGGGDCVIVLYPENKKNEIISSLMSFGARNLKLLVGGSAGVKIRTNL